MYHKTEIKLGENVLTTPLECNTTNLAQGKHFSYRN